jgi:hypothetical protein
MIDFGFVRKIIGLEIRRSKKKRRREHTKEEE